MYFFYWLKMIPVITLIMPEWNWRDNRSLRGNGVPEAPTPWWCWDSMAKTWYHSINYSIRSKWVGAMQLDPELWKYLHWIKHSCCLYLMVIIGYVSSTCLSKRMITIPSCGGLWPAILAQSSRVGRRHFRRISVVSRLDLDYSWQGWPELWGNQF